VNAEAFQNFALVLEKVITKFLCVTLFRGLTKAILTQQLQKAGYDRNSLLTAAPVANERKALMILTNDSGGN
jgi:hypothetical protein